MIKIYRKTILAILIVLIGGCGTVPKEVVELSYVTGKDLQSVYTSYDTLIHQLYENMRSQRRIYLDEVWFPRFLKNWRDDGELIAIAKGKKIWSVDDEKLIPTPTDSDPSETLNTLNDWVSYALYAYELKETELLQPLNEDESLLQIEVKNAFDRLIIANATITAHLNSLREVQEIQDEVLEALDIKELQDKINNKLINASKNAEKALDDVKEADAKADNLVSLIKSSSGKQEKEN